MKKILLSLAAVAASAGFASAQEFTTFRVCEDQHVLRTSDGADAGHVEYIVVDPAQHRVVSTVVTGGILANRTVVVPIDSFRYGSGREVTLTTVTRERLVSAPVIEEAQITSIRSGRFEPALIERSRTYFTGGASVDVNRSTSRTEIDARERSRTNVDVNSSTNVDVNARGADGGRMRDRANAGNAATENNPPAGNDRSTARGQRPGANNADRPAGTDAAADPKNGNTTKGKGKGGRGGDAATDPSTRGAAKGDAASGANKGDAPTSDPATRGDAAGSGSSTKQGGRSGSTKAGAGDNAAGTSTSGADRAGSGTKAGSSTREGAGEANPAGTRSGGKAGGAAATEHSKAGGASAEHGKGGASAEHGKAGAGAGAAEQSSGKAGKAGGASEGSGAAKTNQ